MTAFALLFKFPYFSQSLLLVEMNVAMNADQMFPHLALLPFTQLQL
jgi:hypothetical protein